VKAGRVFGRWTLIDAGVAPGEMVVTDGQLRLVPGAKVEIKPPAAEAQHEGSPNSQMTNTK
jgi:multidrug efflux system membrane fusion protein